MSFIPRKYCCDGCNLISTDGKGWYAVAPLAEGHLASSPSQIHYCLECMTKMRLAVTSALIDKRSDVTEK